MDGSTPNMVCVGSISTLAAYANAALDDIKPVITPDITLVFLVSNGKNQLHVNLGAVGAVGAFGLLWKQDSEEDINLLFEILFKL